MFNKITLIFILIARVSQAQYDFSSFNMHKSLMKAIQVSNEVIEGRTMFFEKKADEKPLMFQKTRLRIGELNRLANNLSKFIVKTQREVNSERILYDLLEEGAYQKVFFKENRILTKFAEKLKIKIDSLYTCSIRINIHRLSQLENFSEDHFKTDGEFYDHKGNQISFFEQLFYDRSNYGMMMSLNYLLLDIKTFQLLYYGTVMSY